MSDEERLKQAKRALREWVQWDYHVHGQVAMTKLIEAAQSMQGRLSKLEGRPVGAAMVSPDAVPPCAYLLDGAALADRVADAIGARLMPGNPRFDAAPSAAVPRDSVGSPLPMGGVVSVALPTVDDVMRVASALAFRQTVGDPNGPEFRALKSIVTRIHDVAMEADKERQRANEHFAAADLLRTEIDDDNRIIAELKAQLATLSAPRATTERQP